MSIVAVEQQSELMSASLNHWASLSWLSRNNDETLYYMKLTTLWCPFKNNNWELNSKPPVHPVQYHLRWTVAQQLSHHGCHALIDVKVCNDTLYTCWCLEFFFFSGYILVASLKFFLFYLQLMHWAGLCPPNPYHHIIMKQKLWPPWQLNARVGLYVFPFRSTTEPCWLWLDCGNTLLY